MLGKQHTGFRHRLLAMLFLFFNCVCTAAPIIKNTSQEYKQAVSLRLAPSPNTAETEEESRLVASSYVHQLTHFSLKKQHSNHLYKQHNNQAASFADSGLLKVFFTSVNSLPRPGYYAFLFRYTLF